MKILAIILLISLSPFRGDAQQSKVDSIINILNKCNSSKGLDSLSFRTALQQIAETVLTNNQINQIEKASLQFRKNEDEDLYYVVKVKMLESLSVSDKIKAIEYGKLILKNLETSKTPNPRNLTMATLCELRLPYRNSDKLIEGFQFFTDKILEYKKTKDSLSLANCYYVLGGFYRTTGLYESAMYNMKKSISFLDDKDLRVFDFFDLTVIIGKDGWLNNSAILSDYYRLLGDYDKSIENGKKVLLAGQNYYKQIGEKDSSRQILLFSTRHIVLSKILSNQLDSIEYYLKIAESSIAPYDFNSKAFMLQLKAFYNTKKGETNSADSLLQKCWQIVDKYQIGVNQAPGIIEPDYYFALVRIKQNRLNEAITLLLKDIERVKVVRSSVLRDYKLLAELYEKIGENIKAKDAYKSFIDLQESMLANQRKYQTISFETEQQMNEKELSISNLENQNKITAITRNFSIGIAVLLLLIAAGIYSRFYSKKRLNKALEKTLSELKSTQSQLVQQEKLASLGALTAGIAHEIKNPLNFVNNFSELSTELVDEFIETTDETERQELGADLKINLQKINEHGKRADSIVKNMLQHSRSGAGEKQLIDINQLCEEYFNLAFHGKRATDAGFNCEMVKNLDNTLPQINCVVQDISRVILNLINNAFDAVRERKIEGKTPNYKPSVTLTTQQINSSISITIKDNGKGIPQYIKEKIFEPFFTTKPAGQGTGLGLSLSYDIVKAHGGEMKVESFENDGAAFIFSLPF